MKSENLTIAVFYLMFILVWKNGWANLQIGKSKKKKNNSLPVNWLAAPSNHTWHKPGELYNACFNSLNVTWTNVLFPDFLPYLLTYGPSLYVFLVSQSVETSATCFTVPNQQKKWFYSDFIDSYKNPPTISDSRHIYNKMLLNCSFFHVFVSIIT